MHATLDMLIIGCLKLQRECACVRMCACCWEGNWPYTHEEQVLCVVLNKFLWVGKRLVNVG